jgi:hypothetical protein
MHPFGCETAQHFLSRLVHGSHVTQIELNRPSVQTGLIAARFDRCNGFARELSVDGQYRPRSILSFGNSIHGKSLPGLGNCTLVSICRNAKVPAIQANPCRIADELTKQLPLPRQRARGGAQPPVTPDTRPTRAQAGAFLVRQVLSFTAMQTRGARPELPFFVRSGATRVPLGSGALRTMLLTGWGLSRVIQPAPEVPEALPAITIPF